MKFYERLSRFWRGRNGSDTLYRLTVWLILILAVVNLFLHSLILTGVTLALLIWSTFRCFSKNIPARQRENRAVLRFFGGIRNWFILRKNKFRDRKTHIYRKCPACRKVLRLPKIKGDHTVCCPCCGKKFQLKV